MASLKTAALRDRSGVFPKLLAIRKRASLMLISVAIYAAVPADAQTAGTLPEAVRN